MANQVFSDSDQRKILSAFTRVEAEDIGAGKHEKYLALANALAERFGHVRARPANAGRTLACGHHG
jgi:hemerythrin-like domain-containing protein